jgi:ATP-dependent helicase/DNAse subunit B
MPDEPMETFLNKINEICARDPGDDMKTTQVVKVVIDDFYSFAEQETRKVMSWSDFCASMVAQTADGYCGFSSEATRGNCSRVRQEESSDWGF